ncbi:hypothetical protein POM88_013931 [Heracleum sosnowskyi]|uniref:Uncharacterized protein n=1 Tax=Heracleum sosnowskyi TaxID=360622 RepID=A0AAD8MYK9_9APIA|nr:hypothetical protein POM88_013931 [Heracleum sosnowskyi]
MSSDPYVWAWLYIDGNIMYDDVIESTYDRDVIGFVKLHFNLRYEGILNILYRKLSIDPELFKLRVSRRFKNPTTNKYGVVLIADDDDVEYMLESLDDSESKVRVELYIEKVQIGMGQSSIDLVQCSKVGEGT